MAIAAIKNSQILEDDLFVKQIENAKELKMVLEGVKKSFGDILAASAKTAKETNDFSNVDEIKKFEKAVKDATDAEKALNRIKIDELKINQKLKLLQSGDLDEKIKLQEQIRRETLERKQGVKAKLDETNAYKVLTAQVNKAQAEFKELAAQYGLTSKQALSAQKRLDQLHSKLSKIDIAAKDGKRNVGRYAESLSEVIKEQTLIQIKAAKQNFKELAAQFGKSSAEAKEAGNKLDSLKIKLKNINQTISESNLNNNKYHESFTGLFKGLVKGGAIIGGVIIAIQSITRSVGRAIQTFIAFQDANAKLNGILGLTASQTADLKIQQLELGRTTAFTASQVAESQTELAKLGVTQKEIIAMTPGILHASLALGADLGATSAVVAGQLKAFGLEAKEAARVSDVLTKSTQISALDFTKLEHALGIVSPASQAVGVSLERQNAILGAVVDNNVDAGTAATELRNIFIDLANKGTSWEDAMNRIKGSTNKLQTANELFGKRGAVVAKIIADSTEKIDANTKALEDAAGTAERFAQKTLNTLSGDIKLLTSAWEGFLLGIEKGDGAISKLIRGSLQILTSLIGTLTIETQKLSGATKDQQTELNILVDAITNTNIGSESRIRLMKKLNDDYPSFLENIDTESASNEVLKSRLDEVNASMEGKILLMLKEEEMEKMLRKRKELQNKLDEKTLALSKEQNDVLELRRRAKEARLSGDDETALELLQKAQGIDASFTGIAKGLVTLFSGTTKDQIDATVAEIEKINDEISKLDENFTNNLNEEQRARMKSAKDAADWEKALAKEKAETLAKLNTGTTTGGTTSRSEDVATSESSRSAREQSGFGKIIPDKKDMEQRKKIYLKGLKETYDEGREIVDAALQRDKAIQDAKLDALETYSDKVKDIGDETLSQFDREINASIKRQDQLAEAAEKRGLKTTESLALEEKKQIEIERRREQAIKKQQSIQLALSAVKVYSEKVQAGDKNALASTAIEILALETFASTLVRFYEGTEKVKDDIAESPLLKSESRDKHIIRVDGSERILSGRQNAMIPDGMSNYELARIASDYAKTRGALVLNTNETNRSLDDVYKELQTVNKQLKNLEASQSITVDHVFGIVKEVMKTGGATKERAHRIPRINKR